MRLVAMSMYLIESFQDLNLGFVRPKASSSNPPAEALHC